MFPYEIEILESLDSEDLKKQVNNFLKNCRQVESIQYASIYDGNRIHYSCMIFYNTSYISQ